MLLLIACSALRLQAAEVRPISDTERIAVQDAAAYLSGGPEAIYAQLSQASPFRRVAQKEALEEIEVRLGPPQGASWELQTVVPALKDKNAVFTVSYPSGLDDGVLFEMVPESGSFKIENIRMLAQRSSKAPIFAPVEPIRTGNDSDGAHTEASAVATRPAAPMMLALLAAILAAGAAWLVTQSRSLSRAALAGAMLLVALAMAVAMAKDARFSVTPQAVKLEAKSNEDPRFPRLATLLPMRIAMAQGSSDPEGLYEKVSVTKGSAHDVARLWKAASDLQQLKLDEASQALKRFEVPSDIPLVEILRARVAYAQANEVDAALAYERAVSIGPGRDALWWEAAQVLSTLGFDDRARGYIAMTQRIGTRDANVFYAQAMLDASKKRDDDAEAALRRAWSMRPATRENIVDGSMLWSIIRRPEVAPMVNLTASDETIVASPLATTRAIVLPAGATARVSGEYLDIVIGQGELSVPGGACLAPAGSLVVDAKAWSAAEETKALEDLPQLVAASHNAGAFTQPAMRRRMERTASALANHNRWNDLVTLTSGLSARAENVPANVMLLRDEALQRTGQVDEAKKLLAELATNKALQRRKQATTLEQIGEMLASLDLNDEAIRLLDRASSIRTNPATDDRVRQLQMNKRLATKYATYSTPHFQVHYPDDVSQQEAVQIGKVLEDELVRMSKWVPVASTFKPVVVNVVWWEDFRSTYTGSDFILGFYQGKITVPLAGVGLSPEAVGILSHELCHAMVAQATNDQAPHWFQEGIARRMEMVPYQENAFMASDPSKLVSVSLLDAVLRGSPDPGMVANAYSQAATTVRYIETTSGVAGVQRYMQAFRTGATTEEAVQQIAGMTMPLFDMKLRAWGKTAGSAFENPKPIRYDRAGEDIRWSNEQRPATQAPLAPALSGGATKFSGAKRSNG